MQSESQRSFCAVVLYLILFFASIIFVLSSLPATSHPEWCGSWFASAWLADSAIRWRRNGAGGLRKIVVRLRLFAAGFLRFCNSQCCAGRSLPARKLAASAVAGLAAPQAAFALFRKSARCLVRKLCFMVNAGDVLVPKPAGRVSASLRRAGLRLARLNAGVCDSSFTSLPGNNSYFRLALPPVAYSSLPRSREQFKMQNSQFTIL